MTHSVPARIDVPQITRANRVVYDELLSGWLETLTENAQRSYRSDLEHFATWLAAPDVPSAMQALFSLPGPAANALVLQYRKHLLSAPVFSTLARLSGSGVPDRYGFAPATINRRLSALRSVASIARMTGVFSGQIEIRGVRPGRMSGAKPSGVGMDAYHRILADLDARAASMLTMSAGGHGRDVPVARRTFELLRDRTLIRMLHDLFLRRVEVVRLDLSDVDTEGLELDVQSKGARGRRDLVPMTKRVASVLEAYLSARGPEAGALFCRFGAIGARMANSTVNRICKRRGIQSGVICQPHGLRRTAITTGLDRSGGNVRAVASAARHKNPSTTMRYDQSKATAARGLSDMIGEEP